jgi:hypothetical protein
MSYQNGSATVLLSSRTGIVDDVELIDSHANAIERKPIQSPKRRKLDEVSATIRRARFYLNALECIKTNYVTPLGTVESLTSAVEEGALDAITDVIVKF